MNFIKVKLAIWLKNGAKVYSCITYALKTFHTKYDIYVYF